MWIAFKVSADWALASAIRSWLERESLRTRRPNNSIGTTTSGITSAARPASLGLVTISSVVAPTKVTRLRTAIEAELPTTVCTSSVSVPRRDCSSPVRVDSKKPRSSPSRCEYRRCRMSATTRSPSRLTKK